MSPAQLAEANLRQLQSEASIPKIKVSVAINDLQVSFQQPPQFDTGTLVYRQTDLFSNTTPFTFIELHRGAPRGRLPR